MRAGVVAALLCACGSSALGTEPSLSAEGAATPDAAARADAEPGAVVPLDAGPIDVATSPVCPRRPLLAGACVRLLEGAGGFSNCSPPLVGTISAMGPEEARPECFGSDNWGLVVPNSAPAGEPPVIPEDTQWYRVDDGMQNVWTIAVAAPGLRELGVAVGNVISFKHGISYSGYFWHSGNAQIDFPFRGRVVLAVSDSSLVRVVGEGPTQCTRTDGCGGYEWAMRVEIEGEEVVVPPRRVGRGRPFPPHECARNHRQPACGRRRRCLRGRGRVRGRCRDETVVTSTGRIGSAGARTRAS